MVRERYSGWVYRLAWLLVWVALSGILLAGCRQGNPRQAATQMPTEREPKKTKVVQVGSQEVASEAAAVEPQVGQGFAAAQAADMVVLQPGDEIDIRFYYTPELDVTQVIRPDGYISMQLVGEVKAAGKTPAELAGELTTRYGWHLKNPQIAVIVRGLWNRKVYVGGYVTRPGMVAMPGGMTLMEAIMEAGGFDMLNAKLENVLVIRYEDGHRTVYSVDLKPAVEGGPVPQFQLRPRDVIYVPQTRIARLGQWVEQHINAVVPDFIHIAWYPFED